MNIHDGMSKNRNKTWRKILVEDLMNWIRQNFSDFNTKFFFFFIEITRSIFRLRCSHDIFQSGTKRNFNSSVGKNRPKYREFSSPRKCTRKAGWLAEQTRCWPDCRHSQKRAGQNFYFEIALVHITDNGPRWEADRRPVFAMSKRR